MRTLLKEVDGIDWCDGAVMNVRWRGPRLRDVLNRAGVAIDGDERKRAHIAFACFQTKCQDDEWYGGSIELERGISAEGEVILALDVSRFRCIIFPFCSLNFFCTLSNPENQQLPNLTDERPTSPPFTRLPRPRSCSGYRRRPFCQMARPHHHSTHRIPKLLPTTRLQDPPTTSRIPRTRQEILAPLPCNPRNAR